MLSRISLATLSILAISQTFAEASPFHAIPPMPGAERSWVTFLPPPDRGAEAPEEDKNSIERPGYRMHIRPDGSVSFEDIHYRVSAGVNEMGVGVTVEFDLTDIVMRLLGEDPYQYDKMKLLDETRPARIEMRKANDVLVMEEALRRLPGDLQAMLRDPTLSAEQRKDRLFALWDEVAEGGSPHLVEGGIRARRVIEYVIAAQLPRGSHHGFSIAELSRYNGQRESREAFDPYRPVFGPSLPGERLPQEGGAITVSAVADARF